MTLLLLRTLPIRKVPPFPGVPEDTNEYICQLLREKDEARQNYSQETIRSQRLAAELEVAQSDRSVNARGDTHATRLRHIPRRVREVAGHGVRRAPP